jgi:hypothetical protein
MFPVPAGQEMKTRISFNDVIRIKHVPGKNIPIKNDMYNLLIG